MDYEAKSVRPRHKPKKTRREIARCGKDCETQWRCQGLVRGGTAVKLTEQNQIAGRPGVHVPHCPIAGDASGRT